ncbi:MAG: glutaredoxin domain-containing protein [Actinomycetota bacterium]
MNTSDATTGDLDADRIDLYWRPGCGFCMMLRRNLDQLGVERVEHDIWSDLEAAEIVRSHANGNETVPTVVVGGVGMVNPSARELTSFLADRAPHLLPDGFEPKPERSLSAAFNRLFR